ncbi:MAG: hypothetical protein WBD99_06645 [Thermodesulfobacteriota bacterium]
MFKNVIRTIKYTAVIALFFLPIKQAVSATSVPAVNTDTPSYQLYYFWDLRDRDSFFQVLNHSFSVVRVHIQVFDATHDADSDCELLDFNDTFTPFDAHIYDVSNLQKNDNTPVLDPSPQEGGFGFVVITVINQIGAVQKSPVLTGNFRIFDMEGYEYGAKAAGYPASSNPKTSSYTFNFNGINDTHQSDVVGIAVSGAGTANVSAGPSIIAVFDTQLFDLIEQVLNCPPVTFACDPLHFDYGIDEQLENSKIGSRFVCNQPENATTDEGIIRLSFSNLCPEAIACPPNSLSNADFFVGFVGLNNGGNFGNMSTFWAIPRLRLLSLPINITP